MPSKKPRNEKHLRRPVRVTRALLIAGQLARLVLGPITHTARRRGSHPLRSKKRLFLAAGSVAAISAGATLAAAVTFGLFSSTTSSQTSSFSAGTVTLRSDASGACTESDLLPGQPGDPCTLQVTYRGSLPAYLGLDILIATRAQSPGTTPLYNPSDGSNDLQITVTDSQAVPYTLPSTANQLSSCPSPYDTGGYTCFELTDLLVSATPFNNGTNNNGTNSQDIFSTSVVVPTSSTTDYQGGTASVVLLAHAVQAGNQDLGSCKAGRPCDSIKWS